MPTRARLAGLPAKPLSVGPGARVRPSEIRSSLPRLAAVENLLVQCVVFDGVWRRATLMIFCALFFVFTIALGARMRVSRGDSLAWIAGCLAGRGARLGRAHAAAQRAFPAFRTRLPALRAAPLPGNAAQANHFCVTSSWIGCVATPSPHRERQAPPADDDRLRTVLLAFSTTSGSRMAWIYAIGLALLLCARRAGGTGGAGKEASLRRCPDGPRRRLRTGHRGSRGDWSAREPRPHVGRAAHRWRGIRESTSQRFWFWRVGAPRRRRPIPLLGVGAGRFPGEGLAEAMRSADALRARRTRRRTTSSSDRGRVRPSLALALAFALADWLIRAWRNAPGVETMAVLRHGAADLRQREPQASARLPVLRRPARAAARPGPGAPAPAAETSAARASPELLRFASFAVLAVAGLAYLQFAPGRAGNAGADGTAARGCAASRCASSTSGSRRSRAGRCSAITPSSSR